MGASSMSRPCFWGYEWFGERDSNSGSQQSPSPPNEDKDVNPFTAEHPVAARGLRTIFGSTEAVRGIDFHPLHG